MRPDPRLLALAACCAALPLLASMPTPAKAHVVAGGRVFPVTLTFDDPGVGDELTLPQAVWQRSAGPTYQTQLQWEFDKRITPTTAIIINQGWDILHNPGDKVRNGFENTFVTGKWQAYTNGAHEFVVSLGVIREFPGNANTVNIGGDTYGTTAPTIYFGKGFGDLPIGYLRPFAITGELSYAIPDRQLNSAGDNSGNPRAISGGLSLQYSMPYLHSQVRDLGLPPFLNRLIPLVEFDYFAPTAGPAPGNPTTFTLAPGFIYEGDTFQFGIEALIPANKAAGQNVGVIAQLHFFLDDIFPSSLGRPILP
jgi:hypothetical protein